MHSYFKCGVNFVKTLVVGCSCCGAIAANPIIDNIKPGQWYEVPNSHLQSVAPAGVTAHVMIPWSGAAFDTKRDMLIVWGGGHGNYSGNEIYTFSLDSLKWTRVNNPSTPPAVDVAHAADGGPCSRHTYNYIQYVPAIDRFCSFGGAAFYQTGQTGTNHTDAYNFDTKTWSELATVPDRAYGIGVFSAVDPKTGKVWQHGTGGSSILADYNPATDTWTTHGTIWTETVGWFHYYLTAAIDPVHRKFMAIGNNSGYFWWVDSTGNQVAKTFTTTGATAIMAMPSPGFEYDPIADCMVAWSGGDSVYQLNTRTNVWTVHIGTGAKPTARNQNGTFGRFRYSLKSNIYVAVNQTTENVFLYRLSTSAPTPVSDKDIRPVRNRNRTVSARSTRPFDGRFTLVGRYHAQSGISNQWGKLSRSQIEYYHSAEHRK